MTHYAGNKILIVDDEADILEFLQYNLRKEGYVVKTAQDGYAALEIVQAFKPHLIILDLMMPEMDGIETCGRLREMSELDDTFITFLTARDEDYSEVAALESGADDFMRKPVKIRVLLSHIRALLRRYRKLHDASQSKTLFDLGLTIDREKYEVFKNDVRLSVPRKEFEILWFLATKPGKVFLRNEIYRNVWGTEVIVGDRTIDVHISKLRDKIGHEHIKTIKGVGYKLKV